MRHLGILLLIAVASGTSVAPVTAATRHVPSDYATINQALDASSPGDTVLVAPGVYDQYETRLVNGSWISSVAFLRGGVTLLSEAGAGVTTLRMDSSFGDPVIFQAFGESGSSIAGGFDVTGTVPSLSGAQFGFGGRLVLRDCVFHELGSGASDGLAVGSVKADVEVYGCRFENLDAPSGAGIHQTSGTLLVEDSDFLNCRQSAIVVRESSAFPHTMDLVVRRCRFVGNVREGDTGGAVAVLRYPTALVEDSWFESNEGQGAGAILLGGAGGSHTVRGCTFVGNWAGTGEGGAIQSWTHTTTIEGCTFFGNGQQINWFTAGSAVTFNGWINILRNNVIAANTGDQAVGLSGNGSVQSSCNVYWANPLGNTSGFPMDETDLDGDPQFCDAPALDFTVNETSPCLPGNGHASCTELIGAWGQGCGVIAVDPVSWGRLKSGFRGGSEMRP